MVPKNQRIQHSLLWQWCQNSRCPFKTDAVLVQKIKWRNKQTSLWRIERMVDTLSNCLQNFFEFPRWSRQQVPSVFIRVLCLWIDVHSYAALTIAAAVIDFKARMKSTVLNCRVCTRWRLRYDNIRPFLIQRMTFCWCIISQRRDVRRELQSNGHQEEKKYRQEENDIKCSVFASRCSTFHGSVHI